MDRDDFEKNAQNRYQRGVKNATFTNSDYSDISKMSDQELAAWQFRNGEESPHNILAQHEWQSRLLSKQVKWMKFSVISGFIGIILGAFLGAYLPRMLDDKNDEKPSHQTSNEKLK